MLQFLMLTMEVKRFCNNQKWNFILQKQIFKTQKNRRIYIFQQIFLIQSRNRNRISLWNLNQSISQKTFSNNKQFQRIYLMYLFKKYNDLRHNNTFNSFASVKNHNNIQFYVDGQQYFKALAQNISKAQTQVMIAGWWISPQFYLIRPIDPQNIQKNRLSTILKDIIHKKNVKIYILAYRQSSWILPNDSSYTKQALQGIHPNIKVITHPLNVIPSFWSHHQKIVIIDQKIAFIGGMDICYGRYDTSSHLIIDHQNIYPGIEFNNQRIKDFQKVRQFQLTNIIRQKHPRLPWHDVAMKIIGQSVQDISKHFIQYWNFASYQNLYQQRIVLVPEIQKVTDKIKQFVQDLKNRFFHIKSNKIHEQHNKHDISIDQHVNKEYVKPINNQQQFYNQQTCQTMKKQQTKTQQNLPEEKCSEYKNIYIYKGQTLKTLSFFDKENQNQVYRYVINKKQLINESKSTNENNKKQQKQNDLQDKLTKLQGQKKIKKYFVINKDFKNSQCDSDDNRQYLNENYYQNQNQQKTNKNPLNFIKKYFHRDKKLQNQKKNIKQKQKQQIQNRNESCQALRSVSKWSIGCRQSQYQSSIHQAYIDLIKNSEHFIYIQNQFFISAIDGQKNVKNLIAKTIIDRIQRAIKNKQKFRIIVFMPLIPGFAGQLDDADATLPRVIMHWQLLAIYNGQNSIIKSIAKLTPNPEKYIQFYGLRTHALVNNQAKTQIVYLHSKLMIVDDKKAILGSANINDRSMRGTRDSQIAILTTQGKKINSIINGKQYKVNQKIHLLRIKLMKQHFGQINCKKELIDFKDVLDDHVFAQIEKIAQINTNFYHQIFGCYPHNQIQTLKQISSFKKNKADIQKYNKSKIKVKGHAVHFPYKFLCKQNLLNGNALVPNIITT